MLFQQRAHRTMRWMKNRCDGDGPLLVPSLSSILLVHRQWVSVLSIERSTRQNRYGVRSANERIDGGVQSDHTQEAASLLTLR